MTTTPQTSESPLEAGPEVSATDGPSAPRRYIYCISDGDASASLGPIGVDGNTQVFAVPHDGLTAIISATSAEKLEISRGNALAHQRVMEAIMQRGQTVLPVRFNTIAEDKGRKTAEQRIIDHVLTGRRDEIRGLLTTMRPLVEMGVKGLWTNLEMVFRDIVQGHQEIQAFRKKLLGAGRPGAARGGQATITSQIRIGEMVKKALESKKCAMEAALLGRLAPLAADFRKNKTFGDPMFANLALLVPKSQQDNVEAALTVFEGEQAGQVKLRCVGPLAPCNFLELVISWDD
jgi:hypothetical protein